MGQLRQLLCRPHSLLPFLSLHSQVMATMMLNCRPSTREVEGEGEVGDPMGQDHLLRGEVVEATGEEVETRVAEFGIPSTAASAGVRESLPQYSRHTGPLSAHPCQV